MARHEGEEAGGGVAGGVGDPLQRVAHHHHRPGHRGHHHLVQGDSQHHILPILVTSLGMEVSKYLSSWLLVFSTRSKNLYKMSYIIKGNYNFDPND